MVVQIFDENGKAVKGKDKSVATLTVQLGVAEEVFYHAPLTLYSSLVCLFVCLFVCFSVSLFLYFHHALPVMHRIHHTLTEELFWLSNHRFGALWFPSPCRHVVKCTHTQLADFRRGTPHVSRTQPITLNSPPKI